jgi:hypothetical protein
VGEGNQHHTQGQSLDRTNSRSKRDKGPRGYVAQNNPLPMVEEAWQTKMLIGKMNFDRKETSREAIRDHKKMLTEILRRLGNLEANAKRLVEDQRSQKEKMERMAGQFHLYLCYVHHMEITPVDRSRKPSCIRKMCTMEQRKENEARKDGDARHPIILD